MFLGRSGTLGGHPAARTPALNKALSRPETGNFSSESESNASPTDSSHLRPPGRRDTLGAGTPI